VGPLAITLAVSRSRMNIRMEGTNIVQGKTSQCLRVGWSFGSLLAGGVLEIEGWSGWSSSSLPLLLTTVGAFVSNYLAT
jgi:hypothetical protein